MQGQFGEVGGRAESAGGISRVPVCCGAALKVGRAPRHFPDSCFKLFCDVIILGRVVVVVAVAVTRVQAEGGNQSG